MGGGPAGLCAAIALRLRGASVVVLDANIPPVDKACGEGLLPGTVESLELLGVEVDSRCGFALGGIRFVHGASVAEADFARGRAWGVRRTVLHELLIARAQELKVDLQWGVKGVRLCSGGILCGDVRFEPWLIVGADGQQSGTRRAASLDRRLREKCRFGFRRHYRLQPWTRHVEIYWGANCQIYITPISADEIGVALLTANSQQRLSSALALFPALAARLAQALPASSEMGGTSVTRRLAHVVRGNLCLVGDASGSVDAITGEGIGLAVRHALALASAVSQGRLDLYETEHRQIQRSCHFMESALLLLGRHQRLQAPLLAMLARWPMLFQKLLDAHAGERRPICLDASHGHAHDIVDF